MVRRAAVTYNSPVAAHGRAA